MPGKSRKKNAVAAMLILIIIGGLVFWATKFLRFGDGLMPKDIYMEGENTAYSAPMGGFILVTVGFAVLLWLVSLIMKKIRERRERLEREEDEREKGERDA